MDAVQYRKDQPVLTFWQVAKNFEIFNSSIHRWCKQFNDTKGKNENKDLFREQAIFQVMMQKNLSFKKESRDLKDAVEILKEETASIKSVSLRTVTQILGVSISGFKSWLNRKQSKSKRRKETEKKEISELHKEIIEKRNEAIQKKHVHWTMQV